MKLSKLFLLFIMSTLFSITDSFSSSENNNDLPIFYYSTVEFVETPLSPIKGSIPLRKEEAMIRNHYRFAYNEKQQLVSVSFFNGKTEREPNHTANLFTLAHRMEFNYDNGTETVTYYDVNQRPIRVLGNCSSFVYTANNLGFRDRLYFLGQEGHRVVNGWGIYEYQWEYQADGSVIENRFDQAGNPVAIRPGFEFHRLRLYFNPSGHIALMQNIDIDGNLVENTSGASQDRITTNAQGNFLEWNVLNNRNELEKGNGPDVAIGKQAFNKYGYEVRLEHQDENGKTIASDYGIVESKTTFDKFGNLQERSFYNEKGSPDVHKIANYHKLVIEWDETGNRRKSLHYFDVSNDPCIHQTRGYHEARYTYDSKQRLIKLSYHNLSGALMNRKDNGRAYSTFSYHENMEDGKVKHFNKVNQQLKP